MSSLFSINWRELFIPNLSLVELFIRGSIVYLVLFGVLRSLPSRQLGSLAITDLLVVVLFAEAAQNAMARDYTSITEGAVLIGTVIFWSYALNWLGFRFPAVQQFLNPPPLLLVEKGKLLRRNLRRELITEDELMSQFRQQGIEELADVKAAYMEADGSVSVIPEKPRSVAYRTLKRDVVTKGVE
ncbi:DUF421 domain-containing protein [Trichocoleus sp. FACHB-591]|uniref:DUF421 domain-containing protein n=1 Tax=Trichocoleus sp. FACHB-591 TaxID=2692872 RepID=UPI001685678D|nr:YetF domain-containing protein [Trichocoleus sp. FACHB-591]MBD2094995.1 DUF421 domain-containing protein [Trichocoleus sp. FACHB-591]